MYSTRVAAYNGTIATSTVLVPHVLYECRHVQYKYLYVGYVLSTDCTSTQFRVIAYEYTPDIYIAVRLR